MFTRYNPFPTYIVGQPQSRYYRPNLNPNGEKLPQLNHRQPQKPYVRQTNGRN